MARLCHASDTLAGDALSGARPYGEKDRPRGPGASHPMRARRLLRILLLSSLAAVLCAGALIGSAESAPGRNGPRTVIVGFKAGVTPVAQADVLADAGAKPMRRYPQIRSALVSVAQTMAGAIRDLESDPRVAYAE